MRYLAPVKITVVLLSLLLLSPGGFAREIVTNSVHIRNAPDWLKETEVDKTTKRIENTLEWSIRRVPVTFYTDPDTFKEAHGLKFTADAFFKKTDGTLHMGPTVNPQNFDVKFGHELVHAVLFQKYKSAIPDWLEEGLANYVGKTTAPDYQWLANQTLGDVTQLRHPNRDFEGSKYHYQVSTAVLEMIAAKCSLKDLLQLSVGSKLTVYLKTYCEISDINADFKKWVASKIRK